MEQIISFFKYLLSSNTINFIVMVGLLLWAGKKLGLADILKQGISKTENEINDSLAAKESAGKSFFEIKKEIDNLPQELKKINDEAKSNIMIFQNSLDKETDTAIDSIKKSIDSTLLSEEKRVSSELAASTVKKTVERTRDRLKKELESNNELQAKFIDLSIKELEKMEI